MAARGVPLLANNHKRVRARDASACILFPHTPEMMARHRDHYISQRAISKQRGANARLVNAAEATLSRALSLIMSEEVTSVRAT